MKVPPATPLTVAVQLPLDKAQLATTVPTLVLDEVKLTDPVGVLAEFVVSATVTLQEPVVPASNDPMQATVVDVLSSGAAMVNITVAV